MCNMEINILVAISKSSIIILVNTIADRYVTFHTLQHTLISAWY